jgi:hypothetical protein
VARRRSPTVQNLQDRGGVLLEDAAERSRTSARARVARLAVAARSVAQIGLAATLAWLFAVEVLGNPSPFFAPIAAIVTLGVTNGQRGRRAVELWLGVATGILIADLLVLAIGTGTLQLGLVVLLAVSAAILLGRGPLLVNQAAISAVLVVTIAPPEDAFAFDRFFDALAGGAVALAVNALVLPADPVALVRRAAAPLVAELAATLEDIGAALRERDPGAVERAVLRSRGLETLVTRFHDAVDAGRETARLAPPRRRARTRMDDFAIAAAQVDLAVRNVRVLARGGIRALNLDDRIPPEVADALDDLAAAVRALGAAIESDDPDAAKAVHGPALRAAGTASAVLERTGNLSVSVIVGQVRSTAVDLLRGAGVDGQAARAAVRDAAREAEEAALGDGP